MSVISTLAAARDVAIPEGPAGRRRRMVVLLICSSSLFMAYLDATILNIALPTLQADLHASLAGLQWVADAYLLVLTALLLLAGSLADRFGRRRLFTIGLFGFSLGSLLCSLAPNTGSLIALRMLQALGGSMLVPVSLSIVRNTFTDARERARALGIWSGIFGLAAACAAAGRARAAADDPLPGHADVRGDPGAGLRVGVGADPDLVRGVGRGTRRVRRGRAAPRRAAARAAVLPQPAVLRRQRDRRAVVHRARRVPVRDHAVPAAGARLFPAGRRAGAAARHGRDGHRRPGGGRADRVARAADPAGGQRRGDRRGRRGAAWPVTGDLLPVAGAGHGGARRGPGIGQPADHQHRRQRHAAVAGGRSLRGHLGHPPVRQRPRRGRHGGDAHREPARGPRRRL